MVMALALEEPSESTLHALWKCRNLDPVLKLELADYVPEQSGEELKGRLSAEHYPVIVLYENGLRLAYFGVALRSM